MKRCFVLLSIGLACQIAGAGEIFIFSDPSGLSAEVEFVLLDPTTLEVRAKNTSTGVPDGFDNSDQILTSIAWDFGEIGPKGPIITSGTVLIGPNSVSLNFDAGDFGPGFDVSGEWGFGNGGGTGLLMNFISAMEAQTTPFGGVNLDGPVELNGPQGGMVADPLLIPLGGLGAIQDEIIATLSISEELDDLSFLNENLVRVEFGSDAFFITVPEPATLAPLAAFLLIGVRRRR